MSQETIKPCPFCGAPALMRSGMGEWWVVCSKDCGPMLATENEAIAAWNRRAPSPVVRALKIRNLIAAREANTAQANQELSRDGWLCDHAQYDREYAAQIDELLAAVESEAEGGK